MSIIKIAEIAGVSIATVSNVMNGTGRVSGETADRVMRVAGEQGLRLRGKRRNFARGVGRIAFAATDDLMSGQSTHFRMRLMNGIQSLLDQADCSLLHSSRVDAGNIARQTRDAAAVILVGFNEDPGKLIAAAGKPVIWVLRNHPALSDSVQEDNGMVARLVVDHMFARGRRHIGYLDDESVDTVVERGRLMQNLLDGADGRVTVVRGKGVFSRDDGGDGVDVPQARKMLGKMLSRSNPPTGLFVPGDLLTVAVYSLLRERGIEPGRDMEVVSCNSLEPYVSSLSPRPPLIDLCLETIGRRAAGLALWRLANPEEPPVRVLVRPSLLLPEER